jgi:hypothetical protein
MKIGYGTIGFARRARGFEQFTAEITGASSAAAVPFLMSIATTSNAASTYGAPALHRERRTTQAANWHFVSTNTLTDEWDGH